MSDEWWNASKALEENQAIWKKKALERYRAASDKNTDIPESSTSKSVWNDYRASKEHQLVKVMKKEFQPNSDFPVGDCVPIYCIQNKTPSEMASSLGYAKDEFKNGVSVYLYTGPITENDLVFQGYSTVPSRGLEKNPPGGGVPQPGFPHVRQSNKTLSLLKEVGPNERFATKYQDIDKFK